MHDREMRMREEQRMIEEQRMRDEKMRREQRMREEQRMAEMKRMDEERMRREEMERRDSERRQRCMKLPILSIIIFVFMTHEKGCRVTEKTMNLDVHFSRQGNAGNLSKILKTYLVLHREFTSNTVNFEVLKIKGYTRVAVECFHCLFDFCSNQLMSWEME